MFSRLSVLIAAVILSGLARGLDVQHQAAYNRSTECIEVGFTAANESLQTTSNRDAVLCHYWKALHPCLIAPFNGSSADDSKILDFFRAYEWQLAIMTTKSHLCSNVGSVEKLKDLAIKSGIMKTESLPHIENDTFVECAGDVHRKCFERGEKAFEHIDNTLKVFTTPSRCYKENLKKCNVPILKHMYEFIQAFKKHLAEKHGLFGGLVAKIDI